MYIKQAVLILRIPPLLGDFGTVPVLPLLQVGEIGDRGDAEDDPGDAVETLLHPMDDDRLLLLLLLLSNVSSLGVLPSTVMLTKGPFELNCCAMMVEYPCGSTE